MSTQTLEFITDAELQAASGGGIFRFLDGKIANGHGPVVPDAATSKGQLQDLQLGKAWDPLVWA